MRLRAEEFDWLPVKAVRSCALHELRMTPQPKSYGVGLVLRQQMIHVRCGGQATKGEAC